MDKNILSQAATEARGLAIDAVHACSSGHLGLPLGCAEMGAVLFGEALNFHPQKPKWVNRDRFILSAGHGSMFIYSWLHLAGYDVSLDDLKNFRQLHSRTPGHPESFMTEGVECTTGPLGQGVGNAVGMAMSAKMSMAKFNTREHAILDYHIVCLAGDGCMQEGVAQEACQMAGHIGLDNVILIYDSNDVTLDAMAEVTQSDDVATRYQALGWDVKTINGHDMDAFLAAFLSAKSNDNGKPKLIIAKTEIGRGIPEVSGTAKAHGEGGAKYAHEARQGLGLPEDTFYVSDATKAFFQERAEKLAQQYASWESRYNAWKQAEPVLAGLLEGAQAGKLASVDALLAAIPEFPADAKLATRAAGGKVLNALAKVDELLISGSADLHGSTKNYIDGVGDYSRENPSGRNILFGIREHAMGAIVNGFGYDGIWKASGATFLTFADYMRASVRLAALSGLRISHIFTHDSIGVGEDGPTHQPVEQVSALRCIPNLDVIRPGDPEETAGAFVAALTREAGPSALILSRQNLPNLTDIPAQTRREGVLKGAYVARQETGALDTIIIATGSELHLAMKAAKELGEGVRVVSMPCMERFDRQSKEYQESVLPASCQKRVSIEAGVTGLWWKYVGSAQSAVIGTDRFGISAPGDAIMKEYGITSENLVATIKAL